MLKIKLVRTCHSRKYKKVTNLDSKTLTRDLVNQYFLQSKTKPGQGLTFKDNNDTRNINNFGHKHNYLGEIKYSARAEREKHVAIQCGGDQLDEVLETIEATLRHNYTFLCFILQLRNIPSSSFLQQSMNLYPLHKTAHSFSCLNVLNFCFSPVNLDVYFLRNSTQKFST